MVFNQAIYTTIYEGKFFFYTPDLFMNPEGSYFAIHFSPILLLILPLYALLPSVQILLVVKSFIIGAAALPLFYLTEEYTRNKVVSLFIAIAYLLYPGTHGANWFDFQPQTFIPILTFSTFLALKRERWKTFFTFLLLTLSTQEHVFAIVISILLGQLIYLKKSEVKVRNGLNVLNVSLAAIIASLLYHYLAKSYVLSFPIAPEFINVYKAFNVFKIIEYKGNLLFLPVHIILNSGSTLKALVFDVYHKFLYFIFIFLPLYCSCRL